MRKFLFIAVYFLLTSRLAFTQKKSNSYHSISSVNIEDAFPMVCDMIFRDKAQVEELNWAEKRVKSSFIYYQKMMIVEARAKWLVAVDENNNLDVDLINVQIQDSKTKVWEDNGSLAVEKDMKRTFINNLEKNLSNEKAVREHKDWFYRDLFMITKFSEFATEVAMEKWFNAFLKDKKVKWKTSLAEVKNSQYQNYKYSEIFYGTVSNIGHDDSKLVVVKLTDSDRNATSAKGSSIEFEGFCRAYKFKPGEIGFVLSDRLDSLQLRPQATGIVVKQPNVERKSSDLDELKRLKELLDQGVITKSEFDTEKKKILDRRN